MHEQLNRAVLWITALALIVIEFYSIANDTHYKWDFFILIGAVWAVYLIRDKIRLHPFHFFLLGIFIILHNLGTFGFYSLDFLSLSYDFWLHMFFGIVSGLIVYRSFKLVGPYDNWLLYVAVIALVLGMSALHEILEYGGATLLGEGDGVLRVGAGDLNSWDTEKDMRNNLIGSLVALILYTIYESVSLKGLEIDVTD